MGRRESSTGAGTQLVISGGLRRRLIRNEGVERTFLRWTAMRAVCHRGYVLVSSLYFVVEAGLSASQLVLLGTIMSVTLLVADVPTGVLSDAMSRKWPLVIGHVFLAVGMAMTGVVTAFLLLAITQVLWGIGWGFSSGADVAWVTDELDRPDRIARVLTARARWDLLGGAAGMIGFGLLGWAAGLGMAIVASGVGMGLAGAFAAAGFPESGFVPTSEPRWRAARSIFRGGLSLARKDREILLVLAATMIFNGASIVAWLFPKQLIDQGFPKEPVLWYAALGILGYLIGAVALRIVEGRIDGVGVARRTYALACFIGVAGLFLLASAPNAILGSAGVLLASGISFNVTRAVSVIWVNRRTTSDVRATMHSFLSQAESVGEIVSGFGLTLLARAAGASVSLVAGGGLIAVVAVMVWRARADRERVGAVE